MTKFCGLRFSVLALVFFSIIPGAAAEKPIVTGIKGIQTAPSYFIPNRLNAKTGKRLLQSDVTAFVQTNHGRILFTSDGAYFGIPNRPDTKQATNGLFTPPKALQQMVGQDPAKVVVMKVGFSQQKGTTASGPRLMEKTRGIVNFLIGSRENWQTRIPTYRKLVYENAWTNTDLQFLGFQDHLEYRVILRPGANPDEVVMETAAESLSINKKGVLTATLSNGTLRMSMPVAWQIVDGKRVPVDVSYRILKGGRYGFTLGSYDPAHTVTIDPTIEWASFIGNDNVAASAGMAVATSSGGYTYVTGVANTSFFATQGAVYDSDYNGGDSDAVVIKFDYPEGSALCSTFLGGSQEDAGLDIAVGSNGHLYVTGFTNSSDFPVTSGSFQQALHGSGDAFVVELDQNCSTLEHATFLGGSAEDQAQAIALYGANVYVAGYTYSADFPKVWDGSYNHLGFIGYDTSYNGSKDAFVAKLDSSLTTLGFTTYLGGNMNDDAQDMVLDGDGNIFVGGSTYSTNFPVTSNAYQIQNAGGSDAFMAKLSSTGTALDYSTYLGGDSNDEAFGIALNPTDPYETSPSNATIAGITSSTNFPTTGAAYDTTLDGPQDAFVSELTTGGVLHYSTYIGGSGVDAAYGLDYGAGDEFLIAGTTSSSDFPVTSGAMDSTLDGTTDGFVMWISTFLSHIDYSTYLGGEGDDLCTGVVIVHDPSLGVAVTGSTRSYNFPTTDGAWSTRYTGNASGFVTRLDYHLENMLFSTFFREKDQDAGVAVAVDRYGYVYVAGNTYTLNFPTTPGVVDGTSDHYGEGFVTKFINGGSDVAFSTFIGGNKRDAIWDIALDDMRPVIVGYTQSSNFPVTGTTWGPALHDISGDGFVTKLSEDGSALVFSGYIGGTNWDSSTCVGLDESGAVYVAGPTASSDFPVTAGAWDTNYDVPYDITLTKFSSDGSTIIFSSFLGGSGSDWPTALSMGPDDSIYVTGETTSTDFPTASATSPLETSYQGSYDAFVSRLSSDGSELIFSTYLGGSGYDTGYAILATDSGDAWIVGSTSSSDYPTTTGGWDQTLGGLYDAFVTKISADGSHLVSSTFLGGLGDEVAEGIVQDSYGQIVIAGYTTSSDFPVTGNAMDDTLDGSTDGFVTQLSSDGATVQYGSYIGGSHMDNAKDLASDRYGRLYLTGTTTSPDFPVTTGAFDTTNDTGYDAFVCKLDWSAYTIHATNGEHGVLVPNGDIPLPVGGMKTFYIYPRPGYKIQDVVVDGVSQGVLSHYTFTDVMADHTIDAQFEPAVDPPVIDSFTVTPTNGTAPLSSIYTVTAHAGTGHTIASYIWKVSYNSAFGSTFYAETQNPQWEHTIYSQGYYSVGVCAIDETGAGTWSSAVNMNVSPPLPLPQPLAPRRHGLKTGENVTNTAVNPTSEPISITLQAFDNSYHEVGTSQIIVPQNGSAELSLEPFSGLDYSVVRVVSDTGLLFFTHIEDENADMTAYLSQSQFDTLYLPHIAEGTTYWNTYAFLTNQQRGPITATVAGQDYPLESDEALTVDLEAMLPQPIDELTAWGRFRGVSNNPFTPVPTLSGYEMFVKEGNDGAATELVNRLAYTLYIPHIPDNTDIFWTGFAIINPGDEDANVDFNFYDDNGLFVGHETKTIPAGGKLKGLMTDLFPDEAGNAKWGLISSNQALTGIEIFGTYQAGICGLTLPDHAQQSGILPDVWTGENNWTGFSLTNMGGFTANVIVQLYDKDGILKAQHTERIGTLNRFKAVVGDYFTGTTLARGDSVRFTSDQPLTAIEVSGDMNRTVMTALTAAE